MGTVQDAITRFVRRYPACDERRAVAIFNDVSRELSRWFRAHRRIRPETLTENAYLYGMCARWEGEGPMGQAFRELAKRELDGALPTCYVA